MSRRVVPDAVPATPRRSSLAALVAAGLLTVSASTDAAAYCIHNETSQEVAVSTSEHADEEILQAGESTCRELGGDQHRLIDARASTASWLAVIQMQAGGSATVNDRPRGLNSPTTIPPDLWLESFDVPPGEGLPGAFRETSLPAGFESAETGSLAPKDRSVRFLAAGDPQYWEDDSDVSDQRNNHSDTTIETMLGLFRETTRPRVRGILVAGDMTQSSLEWEWNRYKDATLGVKRFFFDGLGNHDYVKPICSTYPICPGPDEYYNIIADLKTVKRNTQLTARPDDSPHYSWDWHDIHFIQLNLFPGDGTGGHRESADVNPLDSLSFLRSDLEEHVGPDSARPVVLIHHYGFDSFSTCNDNDDCACPDGGAADGRCNGQTEYPPWWTEAQRAAYLELLRDYNVIAMFTGHWHLGQYAETAEWVIPVGSCGVNDLSDHSPARRVSAGNAESGAGRCIDFVAAGVMANGFTESGVFTRHGAFLDVEINSCNELIVTRKAFNGQRRETVTVEFTAPGPVAESCNTAPVADAGGPYAADEGTAITLDASGSSDADDGDTLEYRWRFPGGDWTAWSTDPTASYTGTDDLEGSVELEVRDRTRRGFPSKTSTATAGLTIRNVAPVVTAEDVTIDENGTATLAGTIDDPGDDSFAMSVVWEEGDDPVTYQYAKGTSSFSEPRQYLDDDPSGTAYDVYPISISIVDDDADWSTATASVTVNNLAPGLVDVSVAGIDEGGTALLTATVEDAGTLDTFTLDVSWGDPLSPNDNESFGNVPRSVSLSHTYLDDNPTGSPADQYTIDLQLSDDDLGTTSVQATVDVSNVAPVLADLALTPRSEHGVVELTGTIVDPGSLDTFTLDVDWGDPLSPSNTERLSFAAGTTAFSAQHRYLDDNPTGSPSDTYTVQLTVADDDGGSNSYSPTVAIANVAPRLESLSATAIDENGITTLTGTIVDPGSLDTFTLDVDWGDPLSPSDQEQHTFAAGATSFSITHRYLDDNPSGTASDTYTIALYLVDDDTGSTTAFTSVEVSNLDPFGEFDGADCERLDEGATWTRSGTFGDVGTLDTHTATVDFGDGVVEPVPLGAGTFELSHEFATDGTPEVRVTIADDDGGSVDLATTVRVTNFDPWFSIDPDQWIDGARRDEEEVLVVPDELDAVERALPVFLTAQTGLNALDVLPDGDVLFSPARAGTVSAAGLNVTLHPGRIYRRAADSGAIGVELDPQAAGIDIADFDAIDALADGTFAFSVSTIEHVTVGGAVVRLEQGNVYRYDPSGPSISLFWDAHGDGVPNLDALDVMPDGRVLFSTSTSPFATIGGITMRLWAGDLYRIDPESKSIEPIFDGSPRGLTGNLDAASLGSADGEFPDGCGGD